MIDKEKAMARLDAIEAEAKKLREIIEAPEQSKHWLPKKPTLCYRWDGDERPDNCRVTIIYDFDGQYYRDLRKLSWDHAVPLTCAEALALVDGCGDFDYPWHEAPEWAKFAATDADGWICWFNIRPVVSSRPMWLPAKGASWECFKQGPRRDDDWHLSLRERPTSCPAH